MSNTEPPNVSRETQTAALTALREPFPPERISQLPKPTSRNNTKNRCDTCGGWHGLPAVHIDYVGHADVTDRLLDVDPYWTWEPYTHTDSGLPAITVNDGHHTLWIKLTAAGVTRIGVGTVPQGSFDIEKQLIGDAIRNAAMRFGVALSMWSKSEWSDVAPSDTDAGGRYEFNQALVDRVIGLGVAGGDAVDMIRGWAEQEGLLSESGKVLPLTVAQAEAAYQTIEGSL